MPVLVKIGERLYEFQDARETAKAREIYARFSGDQNSLEIRMAQQGISFVICSV